MVRARGRWLLRLTGLFALIMVAVMVRTGGSMSSATGRGGEAEAQGGAPRASFLVTGPAAGSTSGSQDGEAPAVLRLEGRVVDPQERAVGGARITLSGGRVVESEADGSFAFDGLPEGKYDVVAEHGDQYAETQGVQLDETSEPVMLTLVRGPTLVVRVLDANKQPIPGAAVELIQRAFVTGADGTVRIRGVAMDDEFVIVSAAGYARVRKRVTTSDDPAATIEWTVVLERGAEIAGIVVDQGGAPVPDAYVEVELAGGKGGDSAFADETGSWRVPDIGAGNYVVRASSKQHIATADLAFTHDGAHPTTGLVVHVEAGGEIAGIVVDGAGEPVAEARVTTGSGSETTGADGRFVVRGLEPDKYDVTASTATQGAASQHVVLARGQHVDLKIVLVPSSIAGMVVDANGEPVEDAVVSARSDAANGYASEHTDAYGKFDLGGLPPGRYQVTAQRADSRVEGASLEVATGNRHVKLVVPDPAGITGRVVLDGKPVPYFGISVSEDPDAMFGRITPVRDPDGRFTQRDAEPGTFVVIIVGPGFLRRAVESVHVVSGRVTDLGDISVTRGISVRGRVVDARGDGVVGAVVRIARSSFSTGNTGLRGIMEGDFFATAGAGGYYEVAGLPDSIEGYRIEATHPTLGSSVMRLLAAGETDVELVLAATGSIDGTVVHTRTSLFLVKASRVEDRNAQYYAEIAKSGGFTFPQLPPGEYEVEVDELRTQPSVRVAVTAGGRAVVTIELPEHPVELHVHVAAGCSLVSVKTAIFGELVRLTSCSDGRATIPDLPPGPYQLCVELDQCRVIELPATPVYAVEVAP